MMTGDQIREILTLVCEEYQVAKAESARLQSDLSNRNLNETAARFGILQAIVSEDYEYLASLRRRQGVRARQSELQKIIADAQAELQRLTGGKTP